MFPINANGHNLILNKYVVKAHNQSLICKNGRPMQRELVLTSNSLTEDDDLLGRLEAQKKKKNKTVDYKSHLPPAIDLRGKQYTGNCST